MPGDLPPALSGIDTSLHHKKRWKILSGSRDASEATMIDGTAAGRAVSATGADQGVVDSPPAAAPPKGGR